MLKLLSDMYRKNGTGWICLLHAAGAVRKHKTIHSFATCVMIIIVQIIVTFKSTQDPGRNIDVYAAHASIIVIRFWPMFGGQAIPNFVCPVISRILIATDTKGRAGKTFDFLLMMESALI